MLVYKTILDKYMTRARETSKSMGFYAFFCKNRMLLAVVAPF